MDDTEARRLLDEVARELTDRGLTEGGHFMIGGRPLKTLPASEIVGMGYRDGLFHAFFRDSATPKVLAESADFEEVRAVFVRDVYRLSPFRHIREQGERLQRREARRARLARLARVGWRR